MKIEVRFIGSPSLKGIPLMVRKKQEGFKMRKCAMDAETAIPVKRVLCMTPFSLTIM